VKNILIPMGGSEADASALSLGFAAVSRFRGHLKCIAPRLTTPELASQGVGDILGAERLASERSQYAYETFNTFCARNAISIQESPGACDAVSASWAEMSGADIRRDLVRYARIHDVTVLSRELVEEFEPSNHFVQDLLFGSGRPLLLGSGVPTRRQFGRVIAIAWNDTAASARAVAAALPLLARADKLIVISAGEGQGDRAFSSDAGELARSLSWFGAKVEHIRVKMARSLVSHVFEAATRAHATLVVMGAYGHSREREFILGGFTASVIAECPLPVLLFH
jgi:nucleotide-binding universal stress UspA family protein